MDSIKKKERLCRSFEAVDKEVDSPQRKGRVCAGNPRRVSCAIEILSFQNFYKVLKTGSAGRKDFFDTLSQALVFQRLTFYAVQLPERQWDTTCHSSVPGVRRRVRTAIFPFSTDLRR